MQKALAIRWVILTIVVWLFSIGFYVQETKSIEDPNKMMGQQIYCKDFTNAILIGISKDEYALGTFTGWRAGSAQKVYCSFNRQWNIVAMAKWWEQYFPEFRAAITFRD